MHGDLVLEVYKHFHRQFASTGVITGQRSVPVGRLDVGMRFGEVRTCYNMCMLFMPVCQCIIELNFRKTKQETKS